MAHCIRLQKPDKDNVGLKLKPSKYLYFKIVIFFVPEKLDRCVAKVKAKGGVENPWAVCKASIGKETKGVKEKVNANRQVPLFNPPTTPRKVEPQVDKTAKGIGGQVGKIDSNANTNNMTTSLWKSILDSQLKRNVKEPRT